MALGNNENSNNGPNQPFAYVLIPILGFGLIVSLFTCYRYKRKKARLARLAANDPTYLRDLEAGRATRGPDGVVIVGGRSRRLGILGSREEGLNELGEAPPAYTPNAPKPPSEAGAAGVVVVESVRLTAYSQASEAGTGRSPPLYGEESSLGPGGPAVASTSSAADTTRPSGEARRDASAGTTVAAEASTSRSPPVYDESSSGAGAGAGTGTGTGTGTTSSAGDTAGPGEEAGRGDTTGNAPAADTATPTSTTHEPAPPPRAVLPPSSD